ncbi:Glutathione peroxidase 1, partial [Armadillidium nasatum]
ENAGGDEILESLRTIRPGNNFKPKAEMYEKIEVNGSGAHPLFKFLKYKLPYPADDYISLMTNPDYIIWSPVERSDVSWNFEKFLIDKKGQPIIRYGAKYEPIKVADEIAKLIDDDNDGTNAQQIQKACIGNHGSIPQIFQGQGDGDECN